MSLMIFLDFLQVTYHSMHLLNDFFYFLQVTHHLMHLVLFCSFIEYLLKITLLWKFLLYTGMWFECSGAVSTVKFFQRSLLLITSKSVIPSTKPVLNYSVKLLIIYEDMTRVIADRYCLSLLLPDFASIICYRNH